MLLFNRLKNYYITFYIIYKLFQSFLQQYSTKYLLSYRYHNINIYKIKFFTIFNNYQKTLKELPTPWLPPKHKSPSSKSQSDIRSNQIGGKRTGDFAWRNFAGIPGTGVHEPRQTNVGAKSSKKWEIRSQE